MFKPVFMEQQMIDDPMIPSVIVPLMCLLSHMPVKELERFIRNIRNFPEDGQGVVTVTTEPSGDGRIEVILDIQGVGRHEKTHELPTVPPGGTQTTIFAKWLHFERAARNLLQLGKEDYMQFLKAEEQITH